jgi:hypothetical protein
VDAKLFPITAGLVVLELSTSNKAPGFFVPMPTVPATEMIGEFPMLVVLVQIAIAPFVPEPVT